MLNRSVKSMKPCLVACILFALLPQLVQAQFADSTYRPNTIKVDITSYWLYRNSAVFSYERTRKGNQSWSITAGFQQLPSLSTMDSVTVSRSLKATGFKVGSEYRFYLKKENKFNAPHGIYMGPYITYHDFNNTRSLAVNNEGVTEQADLNTKLNILNLGFQIGYQFVINHRWTIDLIFIGPSISNYKVKMKLDGTFNFDPEDVENKVLEALRNRFPNLDELIGEGEVDANGTVDSWAYGYRYQLLVGYHFGRKK